VHNQTITDTMDKLQAQGKKLMDTIRAQTFLMGAYEKELLAEREQKMKKTTSAITIITIISLTIVLSLLFFGFITYMQVSRQRKKAEQDILEYQRELNKRIADLDEANAELIKMRGQEKFAVTGRIARTIGHEVRNPLTNILLATDQLKLEIDHAERDKNYLFEMIERNSARINQLISDLLDSTKFSELNYEKITVNDLLTETVDQAADRIELSNIKLLQDTREGGNCPVSVDKSKMKIALLNIITNAIEAMHGREGSELIITTAAGPDRCEIRIEDNGPGMDDETLSKLFEAYYTTKIKGNGLGLTNTQNIILNHKGDIVVESEKGKGTRFRIFLNKNN
jgi:signal transduction histidine kinase